MDRMTIERCVETRFFGKHAKHMPAVLNLEIVKPEVNEDEKVVEDLLTDE